MTEFSGVHTDGDFGYVSDVDSDYQDTNVIETVEEKINSNVKSDEKITVKLNAVKNIDGDDDNTVIFKTAISIITALILQIMTKIFTAQFTTFHLL